MTRGAKQSAVPWISRGEALAADERVEEFLVRLLDESTVGEIGQKRLRPQKEREPLQLGYSVAFGTGEMVFVWVNKPFFDERRDINELSTEFHLRLGRSG